MSQVGHSFHTFQTSSEWLKDWFSKALSQPALNLNLGIGRIKATVVLLNSFKRREERFRS